MTFSAADWEAYSHLVGWPLDTDVARRGAEHLLDARFSAPQRRRLCAGRWRQMLAERLEELADESFGCPVGKKNQFIAAAEG